jgi:hypothetical protein
VILFEHLGVAADVPFFTQGEVLYEHPDLRTAGESISFDHLCVAADESEQCLFDSR